MVNSAIAAMAYALLGRLEKDKGEGLGATKLVIMTTKALLDLALRMNDKTLLSVSLASIHWKPLPSKSFLQIRAFPVLMELILTVDIEPIPICSSR